MKKKNKLLSIVVFLSSLGTTSFAQVTVPINISPPGTPFVGWNGGVVRDLEVRNDFNRPITLWSNSIQRMYIAPGVGVNSGFVGIGNNFSNPASRLTVMGNASIGSNIAAPTQGLRVFGRSYFGGNAPPQGIVHIDNNIAAFQLVLESTAPFNPDNTAMKFFT